MSVHIDTHGRLHNDHAAVLALTCPHCEVVSHITPMAVPGFDDLSRHRPAKIGVVFRCDACNSPLFLRFAVRMYSTQRIELAPGFEEVERAQEKFSFTHLPERIELYFREALNCYSAGAFTAFAMMCRRVAHTAFAEVGESGKLKLFDQLNELKLLADLDDDSFALVRRVVFGSDADPRDAPPILDSYQAGVLLEIMKDLLYQAFVRGGRLQQALMVRRFFVDAAQETITPLNNDRSA
ncbi:MAG: hypothetical protein R3E77_05595 [Steroidobacteraceae bacterium]